MIVKRKLFFLMILCSMAFVFGGCGMQGKPAASTNKYPTKPITLIVPYAAGGSADMMARAMEKAGNKHLGQPFVVKNITGGSGMLAWNELAGSDADGYTLGVTSAGVILQPLYGQTRYHYPSALDPLARIAYFPIVVAVLADKPWQNIDDLIQYAKANPDEIKCGHPGLGTTNHIVGEMLAKEAGVNIAQVPFGKGESESLAALLGGHVQLIVTNASVIKEYVKTGRVKVLAATTENRLSEPEFRSAPTFKEQGFNIVFTLWYGIGAPKELPKDVKRVLEEKLKAIVHDDEFKDNMKQLGMTVEYLGAEDSVDKWILETREMDKIVRETGIAERIAAQKK